MWQNICVNCRHIGRSTDDPRFFQSHRNNNEQAYHSQPSIFSFDDHSTATVALNTRKEYIIAIKKVIKYKCLCGYQRMMDVNRYDGDKAAGDLARKKAISID